MHPTQQQTNEPKGPHAINVIALLAQALAASVEVFVRRDLGSRFLDRQAAVAVLLIPAFGLFFPEEDLRPLMWFLGAYLVACGVARAKSLRRRWRNEELHSRSSGWPRILTWPLLRKVSEAKARAFVEPMLVATVGMLTMAASRPLGAYLVTAAVGMMLTDGLRRGYEEQQLMDLRDSLLDQRRLSERFRERRW